MTDGHRIPQNSGDLIRSLTRRIAALERRGGITNIDAYLGTGISPHARQVLNWNDEMLFHNGWFWSAADALNSPDATKSWIGRVVTSREGHGVMEVFEHGGMNTPARYVRQFHYHAPPAVPMFTTWTPVDSGWQTLTGLNTPNAFQTLTWGKYRRTGNTVQVEAVVAIAAGGVVGEVMIDPVAGHPYASDLYADEAHVVGNARGIRAGVSWYPGDICVRSDSGILRLGIYLQGGAGTGWHGSSPATWQVGDRWGLKYEYEAAPL